MSTPSSSHASSQSARAAGSPAPATFSALLEKVRATLQKSDLFGVVAIKDDRLTAAAKASAAPAAYRLDWFGGADGGRVWVSLVTADRWLSQSIEQDLVHTGDKLDDLLDEELSDLGPAFPKAQQATGRPQFEHFRSEDLLFTFRTPLPLQPQSLATDAATETASLWILAYEATFRRLGDMEGGDDED
jgi:hypothetical protein